MFDIIDFIINHGVEVTLKYDNVFRTVTITQKKEDHERKFRFDLYDRERETSGCFRDCFARWL